MGKPSKWIRIDRPFPLPEEVKQVIQRLDSAGFVAYLVGGCVRDFLLGMPVKDYDLATDARPDSILKLFPESLLVGKAFGVFKVPIERLLTRAVGRVSAVDLTGKFVEIATFRKDLGYEDHRHPVGIEFSGPDEDAARRDFTINALFYDPKSQQIYDSVSGLNDLDLGVIRAIGNADTRFREDALRLLRAVRFSIRFQYEIEPETWSALRDRARLIQRISPERICSELDLMLVLRDASDAVELMSESGLLGLILPEVEYLKKRNAFQVTLRLLNHLHLGKVFSADSRTDLGLLWAALLMRTGKEKSLGIGYEQESIKFVEKIGKRLRFSNQRLELIQLLIENHTRFRDVFRMREVTLQRFVRLKFFDTMLELHRADALATDGNLAHYEFAHSVWSDAMLSPSENAECRLTGDDLIQLGFAPGPRFSQILEEVDDLILERKISSKDEALEYVLNKFVK